MLAATLFAVASLLPAVFGLPSPNLHSRANGFNYGGETVRGVNLGGVSQNKA
jgi:hypothetical protein